MFVTLMKILLLMEISIVSKLKNIQMRKIWSCMKISAKIESEISSFKLESEKRIFRIYRSPRNIFIKVNFKRL